MMADCCFDRSKMDKKKREQQDISEIDKLFIDNTKMAPIGNHN